MANRESADAVRSERRRRRAEIGLENSATRRGDIEQDRRPTLDELRRVRSDILSDGSVKRQRSAPAPEMLSAAFSRSSLGTSRSVSTKVKVKRSTSHRSDAGEEPRRRRKSNSKDDNSSQIYVYGSPKEAKESKERRSSRIEPGIRIHGIDDDSYDSEDDSTGLPVVEEVSEDSETTTKRRKTRIVKVVADGDKPRSSKHGSRRKVVDKVTSSREKIKVSEKSLHRSNSTTPRRSSFLPPLDGLKRSLSARETNDSRPILKRSHTTSGAQHSSKLPYEPSIASTRKPTFTKQTGFLGLFSLPHKDYPPIRFVECMTCLSDDIPHSKSAKLKCGHRMCHPCLKRIFRLSVKDPQHMPPKCCTTEHIPIKHVDRLFDIEFKKLWNKKFQEYTTKNRIYCPARRCGEWIKPGNIHTEGGKKFGKCGRCKAKVCCLCNGKWHGNKDCPKDEETNALLEAAKKAGWQRCYSCRTMVELKEGCNHMTCRCTAEFCMICGLKWKSCNCPWFNYEQVEADRINHMRVPGPDRVQNIRVMEPLDRFRPRPIRQPRGYDEELDARRQQELQDEELARRIQILAVDDDDDYNGGIGDIRGIGNAGDHFMNQNFRRPPLRPDPAHAAANYATGVNRARGIPPPPPNIAPVLRRPNARADLHNNAPTTRASERVVPRRTRNDYVSEAARHAPLGVSPPRRPRPSRSAAVPAAAPRPSVLAGLVGTGRGSGRVGAWRTHVLPGVEPAEGVLSM